MTEQKKLTLKELKDKLPEKQKIFCHEYIIDWNGSRSYKVAYINITDDSARALSSKLLTNINIQQYIEYIRHNYEEESGVSKLRNLKELAKIAYSSIAELHDTWISLKEFEALTEDQRAAIESIESKTEKRREGEEFVTVKFVKLKLFAKNPAIDLINKMMGYNEAEKIEHTINSVTGFDYEAPKDENK
ncbi:terminase small subunit [bacterium]|jgi:phage terminase small subunit|nr:terminase small subunit [bacterium]